MNTMTKRRWIRILMLAALLLCLTAISALADGTPAVITANTRVYRSASTSSASAKVKKGMEVDVLAAKNGWALIEKNGVQAYIKTSQLAATTESVDTESLMANAKAATVTSNTKVYKCAAAVGASASIKKGTQVNLLASGGGWSLIERGGVYAYIKSSCVSVKNNSSDNSSDLSDLLANAQDAVITVNTKVYKSANKSSTSARVKKGTQVNLLATNSGWALIERGGVYAYMSASEVEVTDDPEPTVAPTVTPSPTADYSGYMSNAKAAIMVADTKVYESANSFSASVTISKGTKVNLLATNNGWALIEKSGSYGFVDADTVSLVTETTATPTPTQDSGSYMSSSKYSNEQKCYLFLTKEAGLNSAAACGILANIRRESNFNPESGSSYYGLIQWGGGRLTNLKNYCSNNGYSYSSLEGQLRFLIYELKNSYSDVWSYLQSVSNSASGAYDAAYYFCYYYERPANKASSSASRGELARDTYYPKYA